MHLAFSPAAEDSGEKITSPACKWSKSEGRRGRDSGSRGKLGELAGAGAQLLLRPAERESIFSSLAEPRNTVKDTVDHRAGD